MPIAPSARTALSSRTALRRTATALAVGLSVTGLLLGGAPPAQAKPDPTLASQAAKLMQDSRVRNASVSTVILDAADGSEIYAKSGSSALMPASNTKNLTASAALQNLGTGYKFSTDAYADAKPKNGVLSGDLYLKGWGDPSTRVSDLASIAKQVKAAGISKVTGRLYADASYFDSDRYNDYWSTSYASDYYAAQISALTIAPDADLDSGTVKIGYASGKKGKKAKLTVVPAELASYVTVVNKTTTTGSGDSISVSRKAGTNTITVSGKLGTGRKTAYEWVTIDRPDLAAVSVFRGELRKAGVSVAGSTGTKKTPKGRIRVARDKSVALSSLMVPYLKLSNNMIAEHLTKTMGARASGAPGSWSKGLAVTKRYVASTGAPTAGLVLRDGSGLTRSNRISGRTLTGVLYAAQKKTWFSSFYTALPVAGDSRRMVGGTLSSRMRNTEAAGRVHAKTGSLTGVTSLAGYVQARGGRRYVFAMISNYSGTSPRPVEDKLAIAIAKR